MKIAIGINTYKTEDNFNNREKMCVDSLRRVKSKFSEVELFSICYHDEKFDLDGFTTLPSLQLDNQDIANKRLPFVNEIFDVLSTTDCDYFIFINSDVALSDRFIKAILKSPNKDCFPATKLHFTKLDSIDDPNPIPQSVSVHGFDGFGIKSTWWKQNKHHFNNILLSRAYWDTYFFTKCMIYGDCIVLNKPPLCVYHLDHKSTSMEEDIGNKYNTQVFSTDVDNVGQKWFGYVYNVLLKRPTHNNILWYVPFSNEEELEQIYFKQ